MEAVATRRRFDASRLVSGKALAAGNTNMTKSVRPVASAIPLTFDARGNWHWWARARCAILAHPTETRDLAGRMPTPRPDELSRLIPYRCSPHDRIRKDASSSGYS